MNEIQNKLNELWAGTIDFYEFDIIKQTITFYITLFENEKITKYSVIFKGVSSYHFYKDSEERRFNTLNSEEGYYLELTSIQFYKNGIGDIITKSKLEAWAKQYYSNANFVLEIWNSMLFIEASSLIVNDVEYEVTLPLQCCKKSKLDLLNKFFGKS